jgi:hypothetical protein
MNPSLYLEHLTDPDLAFLAAASGQGVSVGELVSRLYEEPPSLERLLGQPSVFAALFDAGDDEALLRASPFLVFAVLVHRVQADLAQVSFIEEWIGPGRRVPMFDVAGLQEFAAGSPRRLFLAELLASYTHVASGSTWVRTARGWRRRRFSELDPLRLMELAELVPEVERPAVYRRLGDLALFLTGVFPDYAGDRFLPSIAQQRLQRALRRSDREPEAGPPGPEIGTDAMRLLEQVGRRSYRLAWRGADAAAGEVLAEVAEGFGQARRLLNFLTDRYLFTFRHRWFVPPA